MRVEASPPRPTPGDKPTAVWRVDCPSGQPASWTPETGKNCPRARDFQRSGVVGAGSDTSAHLFCPSPTCAFCILLVVTILTNCSPCNDICRNMLQQRSFGKLGNRASARLATAMEAGLILPDRRVSCLLENISRKGCRLYLAQPPRVGTTVIVKVDRVDALGDITWVRGARCGVAFESPISPEALERIRWAVDHSQDHEKSKLTAAAAVWR